MRTGVIELVAFEVDFGAAEMLSHALGKIKRAWPAHIMGVQARQFRMEGRIAARLTIGALEL